MRFTSFGGLVAANLAAGVAASTYDYIVVGGGPAGIITAERLTEANKKVLLLERGQGPTVATGANSTLSWNDTLTPIDVPGLSAAVGGLDLWNEYICTDTPSYAACVLGGGVTVNYMVFVRPPQRDFDDKWPTGWNWDDISSAAERLYERNPGSISPSEDDKPYDTGLYNTLSSFFDKNGWNSVDMLEQPDEKHQVYSWPSWNIKDTLRAGPVRTYLPLAQKKDNFTLRLGTKVIRVVRSGSKVTGVEVENSNGESEIINLAKGGRVVLSAGALSTPRILFNSGIGPKEQIQTAKEMGITLPPQKQWIELPVGKKLMDHPIFTLNLQSNGTWGAVDTDSILNGNDTTDINLYESKGSGVMTQGRHRVIYFTSKVGSDGITRYYQGSCGATAEGLINIKLYMTHGLTSTGVLGLAANGSTVFEQVPYLQSAGDKAAAAELISEMIKEFSTGFELDSTNVTSIMNEYTNGVHYAGSARIGTDDGRKGGSAVVDLDAKVYGTDNLFISDASIHPDLPTGNIQATVMVVAEAAVAKILACK